MNQIIGASGPSGAVRRPAGDGVKTRFREPAALSQQNEVPGPYHLAATEGNQVASPGTSIRTRRKATMVNRNGMLATKILI